MDFSNYYKNYWQQRLTESKLPPIRDGIPGALRRFTTYGAILEQIPQGSVVLDIGCGDGHVASLYCARGEVHGVDIAPPAVEAAKAAGVRAICHDLNDLPLPLEAAGFDVVVMTDVVEHVIDPLLLMKEALRLVKPGGRLIVTVPNFARLTNRLRMCFGDPVDLLHWSKYGDEVEHLHWFTKPKLRHLLKQAGFCDVRFVPTGLPSGFLYGLFGCHGFGKMLTATAKRRSG